MNEMELNNFGHSHPHLKTTDFFLDPETIAMAVRAFPLPPLFAGEIPKDKLRKVMTESQTSFLGEDKEFDAFLDGLERLDNDPSPQNMRKLFTQFGYRQFKPVGDEVYVDLHPQPGAKPLLRLQRLFEHPFDARGACDVMYRGYKEDNTIEVSCIMCPHDGEPKSEILVLDPNCPTPTFFNLYFDYDALIPTVLKGPDCERRFRETRLLGSLCSASDEFHHERLHARDKKTMDELRASLGTPKIIIRRPSALPGNEGLK